MGTSVAQQIPCTSSVERTTVPSSVVVVLLLLSNEMTLALALVIVVLVRTTGATTLLQLVWNLLQAPMDPFRVSMIKLMYRNSLRVQIDPLRVRFVD